MVKEMLRGLWQSCSYLFGLQRRPKEEIAIESLEKRRKDAKMYHPFWKVETFFSHNLFIYRCLTFGGGNVWNFAIFLLILPAKTVK